MATNNLTFTQTAAHKWEAKFVATGEKVVVQIDRAKAGAFHAFANLPGMTPVPVASATDLGGANLIFELNVASGVEITLQSLTEPTSAKIMSA